MGEEEIKDDKVTVAIHCNGKPNESAIQIHVGIDAPTDYISRALTLLDVAKMDLLNKYMKTMQRVK